MPTEKVDGRRGSLRDLKRDAGTNTGLWLDKFLNLGAAVGAIRDSLADALGGIKCPEGYVRAFSHRQNALESLDGGFEDGITRFWAGEVQGRMVVGLGEASVRETGISLLHTWGMPFIPGSALKGVAAAMARHHAGEIWKPTTAGHRALFGDHELGGCVVFHDAWWIPGAEPAGSLPLDLDVMTVHHSTYYGGDAEGPCDWDEPNPVSFLTARGRYLVALSGPANWVDAAGALLTSGLAVLGVGGKTAAGYGRVALERHLSEAEKARAKQTEFLRGLVGRFKDASNAADIISKLLQAQANGADPADVRDAIAALVRGKTKFWKDWLKKPARTAEERELIDPHLAS